MYQTFFLIIFFSISSIQGFAQSQADFDSLIAQTNRYLEGYNRLNPFGDYLPISGFDLTEDELRELLSDADYDATLSLNKDSIDSYRAIFVYQAWIIESLDSILAHDKLQDNDISELLDWENSDLYIIMSEDRKLYNISLDEKTGGTYRSRISLMHYTEIEVDASMDPSNPGYSGNHPYGIFSNDGYNSIHTLETDEGTKYVLSGSVRGCSYCFETSVALVHFDSLSAEFIEDFYYSVDSRDWKGGAYYDHETQSISVDYYTDDLTTSCNCTRGYSEDWYDEYYYEDESGEMGVKCHCKFVFNGSNFELVEACMTKELAEDE